MWYNMISKKILTITTIILAIGIITVSGCTTNQGYNPTKVIEVTDKFTTSKSIALIYGTLTYGAEYRSYWITTTDNDVLRVKSYDYCFSDPEFSCKSDSKTLYESFEVGKKYAVSISYGQDTDGSYVFQINQIVKKMG